ncbi:hypothetical protein [Dinghuibacter silviterrae]|uniref:Uncharacterized protein n=1 Tax=Dinghuibacter silviterrae TaxID=1539049 RepID=A0A4R8DQX7_9BACT|nr:hypothetical protein [Dinghuibacter silviterrae]TDX00359.1 hypothetical protein EDB95_1381 [Dinghuibacter silviterrae]
MKVNHFLWILTLSLLTASCHWVKERSKDAVHGTGEAVGQAGSEFASGVAKGVQKTFSNQLVVSNA